MLLASRFTVPSLAALLVVGALPAAGCLSDTGRVDGVVNADPTEPADPPTDRTTPATPRHERGPMDPVVVAPQVPLVCAEATAVSDGVLVLASTDGLDLVRGDGRVDALRCAYEQIPADATPRHPQLLTADQVVVTSVGWGGWQEPGGVVVSALGTGLELLWQHAWPNYNASITAVSDSGAALVSRHTRETFVSEVLHVAPDGTLTFIPEAYRLIHGGRFDTLLPVARSGEGVGWLNPVTMAFTLVVADSPQVQLVGGRMVAFQAVGNGLEFVISDGTTTTRFEVAGLDAQRLWFAGFQPRFALFEDQISSTLVRIDLDLAQASMFTMSPPEGLHALTSCVGRSRSLDSEGRVLAVFRDERVAQVYRLDDAAGTWTAVGFPMTGVDGVDISVVGETVMLQASPPFTTYCPTLEWLATDAPNVQVGASTQVVLGDAAPLVVAGQGMQISLSEAGKCITLQTWGEATANELIDLTNGTRTELPTDAHGIWMP